MAWGTYMLRKPLVLVFFRLWVRARHHEEAAMKIATLVKYFFACPEFFILTFLVQRNFLFISPRHCIDKIGQQAVGGSTGAKVFLNERQLSQYIGFKLDYGRAAGDVIEH